MLDDEAGNCVCYSIKYVHTVIADDPMCDPVFVLADENMGDEDVDVQECRCLALDVGAECTGWVTFIKTRCWNIAGYTWYNNKILR